MNINTIKAEIKELTEFFRIEKRTEAPHPKVDELWEKIPEDMAELELQEAISVLSECSQDEIEALSPVFDLIINSFNTKEFNDFIISLKNKFMLPVISENIDLAIS